MTQAPGPEERPQRAQPIDGTWWEESKETSICLLGGACGEAVSMHAYEQAADRLGAMGPPCLCGPSSAAAATMVDQLKVHIVILARPIPALRCAGVYPSYLVHLTAALVLVGLRNSPDDHKRAAAVGLLLLLPPNATRRPPPAVVPVVDSPVDRSKQANRIDRDCTYRALLAHLQKSTRRRRTRKRRAKQANNHTGRRINQKLKIPKPKSVSCLFFFPSSFGSTALPLAGPHLGLPGFPPPASI